MAPSTIPFATDSKTPSDEPGHVILRAHRVIVREPGAHESLELYSWSRVPGLLNQAVNVSGRQGSFGGERVKSNPCFGEAVKRETQKHRRFQRTELLVPGFVPTPAARGHRLHRVDIAALGDAPESDRSPEKGGHRYTPPHFQTHQRSPIKGCGQLLTDPGGGHQEGGGELVCFRFGLPAPGVRVLVENQVRELMSRIEA